MKRRDLESVLAALLYSYTLFNYRYEMWFAEQLPKLPTGSVIMMDNASYHTVVLTEETRVPTTSWKKGQIQQWLINRGEVCHVAMKVYNTFNHEILSVPCAPLCELTV